MSIPITEANAARIEAAKEEKLQAFLHAQILVDEHAPGAEERVAEALAAFGLDGLPPCARCGYRIDNPVMAIVSKRSADTPLRIMHAGCDAEELDELLQSVHPYRLRSFNEL